MKHLSFLLLVAVVGCGSPLCYSDKNHDKTNYFKVDDGMLCGSYEPESGTWWARTDEHWGGRTFATEETAKAFVEEDCTVRGGAK